MVRVKRLELPRRRTQEPKSCTSTNSVTPANTYYNTIFSYKSQYFIIIIGHLYSSLYYNIKHKNIAYYLTKSVVGVEFFEELY